jgi:hypothetical protein
MRRRATVGLILAVVSLAAGPVASQERAREIVDRAITAAGGETRLAGFKAAQWTCKGTGHASSRLSFIDHCFIQWPERFRQESSIEAKGQTFARALVLDGEEGWIKQGGATVAMNGAAVAELRDKVHVLRLAATLLPLKDKGITLAVLDEGRIDGRPAVGVTATCAGRPDLRLYFDKDSGLLVKCERAVNDVLLGEVSEETFFADYQKVEGVQVAHKVVVKRGGKPFLDWTVTDFQLRAKLDGGLFGRP